MANLDRAFTSVHVTKMMFLMSSKFNNKIVAEP